MTRRQFGAGLASFAHRAGTPGEAAGAALLIRMGDGHVLGAEGPAEARRWLLAPGSLMKPFTVMAAIQAGTLGPGDQFVCRERLRLEGYSFDCVHPPTAVPMTPARALAYSCNGAVAHWASRLNPAEFANFLRYMGFETGGGVQSEERLQVEALGANYVATTPDGIAAAYRRLALWAQLPAGAAVLQGLEQATEFGTAQAARVRGMRVAAKTGTVPLPNGARAALCAGWAPSRRPEVAFAAVVQGRAGGSDAAPLAARLLASHFGSRA